MTLIFPAAFVAAEFFKSRVTPAATWGSIAYTQYQILSPIMQIAALVGPLGHHLRDNLVRVDGRVGVEPRLRMEHRAHAGAGVRWRARHDGADGGRPRCASRGTDPSVFSGSQHSIARSISSCPVR